MADLSELMRIAPGTAAFFTGQNQAQKNLKDIIVNQGLQQEMALGAEKHGWEREMQPHKLKNQSLLNQGLEAELPGKQADSKKKGLDAQLAQDTYSTNVEATNATNRGKVDKEKYENFERAQSTFMRIGAQLDSVPAPLRGSAFRQMVEQAGMNAQAPHIAALMNMDPNMMPKAAQALAERLGKQMLAMNPAAQASMYSADKSSAAHRYGSDKQLEGVKYAADQRAKTAAAKAEQAKVSAKTLYQHAVTGKISTDEAVAAATIGMATAETEEERTIYRNVARQLELYVYNKTVAGQQGKLGFGEGGKLTPRTITPVLGGEPEAPKPPSAGPFKDTEKERRYQEWKARQSK